MSTWNLKTANLSETNALGQILGSLLEPRTVLALDGPLGAGKTAFTRAVAEGLAIADPRMVTSPTFLLIQEYPARLPIYHLDVYRLGPEADLSDLGVGEYFEGDGVCLVEWADRVRSQLPPERLDIRISAVDPDIREFHIEAHGSREERTLDTWRQRWMAAR